MIQAEKVKLQEQMLEMQFKFEDTQLELERKISESQIAESYKQRFEGSCFFGSLSFFFFFFFFLFRV